MDAVTAAAIVAPRTQPQPQPGAPLLQPGTVITALVVQLLEQGQVRLAVGKTLIDVLSQVPLARGTTVRLAVEGTPSDLKLVIIGGQTVGGARPAETAALTATGAGGDMQVGRMRAHAPAIETGQAPEGRAQVPQAALSEAVRSAAARQNGLAPLLADVAAAADGDLLPEPVRQAANELLALRLPLRSDLTASDVKQAFARSGLLLEAKLAAVSDGAPAEAAPDLKAALGVFRQVLRAWLDTTPPAAKPAASPVLNQGALPAPDEAVAPQLAATPARVPGVPVPAQSTGPTPSSPTALPGAPAAPIPLAAQPDEPGEMPTQPNPPRDAAATGRTALATLIDASTLQRGALPAAAQAMLLATAEAQAELPGKAALNPGKGLTPTVQAEPETPAVPPPPHRGAPPAPQPAVAPSLTLLADPRAVGETLLVETEAALARQTLLQAASLPDRAESPGQRSETSGPRWNFEVPIATPHGTAIAQFEIGRDGHAAPSEASPHAWRVRFTLDVEPMGPVHAHIALAGPRASVSLWAERGTSAVQLREHAALLRDALVEAEFEPGEVVVREGAPPHTLAAAGRFLDLES